MSEQYLDIPKEKFELAVRDGAIHDKKFDTKPIGFFKDAFIRFCKNKSSVIAAIIIIILVIFAIVGPFCTPYTIDDRFGTYLTTLPRANIFYKLGIHFWDGTRVVSDISQAGYDIYAATGAETETTDDDAILWDTLESYVTESGKTCYTCRIDSYQKVGYFFYDLEAADYEALQAYQNETGIQVMYPVQKTYNTTYALGNGGANFWYQLVDESDGSTGLALRDENGNLQANYLTSSDEHKAKYNSIRVQGIGDGENGVWYTYAVKNQTGYRVRVNQYEYFKYLEGQYPSFLLGTNGYGQDILACLSSGARLSLLLAVCVSAINLTIGAIYGAIEGYYGGAIDLTMERISDILASVPFIVVATLFQMHLASKVGPIPSLLFAFVMTGWIGMASTVRMQFYRFKSQEYILAARTLGAKDWRIMFKHIFPNAIGTIITSCVLSIPGVIFSESMLTYLNIVNLETSSMTSIGTMLSGGQGYLTTYPHVLLFPAIFISLLEVSFNLFGNGLRDAFNPSLRGVEE